MKKSLLLAGLLATAFGANAQTPVKKSTSMVHKITATWCPPCGGWGWDLANELIAATASKAVYVSLFASSDGSWDNSKFYNQTAHTLANQFTLIGYPDFGANAITHTGPNFNGSTINLAQVKTDVLNAVNTFATTDAVANAASKMTISGNTVTVNANVKFWEATSGEYYLAAYLIEDGALNKQANQNGIVAHHGVLRTSMTEGSAWGVQIANGAIAANHTESRSFTFTVTNSEWDKSKFKIYNVIWKKEGGLYKFINVSENESTTSINELVNSASVEVYPNPASNAINVSFDAVKSGVAELSITNIIGQQVAGGMRTSLNTGSNFHTLDIANLSKGIYILNIKTGNGSLQRKFVKE
jgi:hypothetical protein